MRIQPLIVAVIAGAAVWGLIEIWLRWRAKRGVSLALDLRRRGKPPSGSASPEGAFVVRLSDSEVVCERPDGRVERVAWSDLQRVEILTTDAGPFAPDVFWVLHGTDGGCVIPQGATGDRQLLERLQTLPGFDNGAVIAAMSSAVDMRFPCWRREGKPGLEGKDAK